MKVAGLGANGGSPLFQTQKYHGVHYENDNNISCLNFLTSFF